KDYVIEGDRIHALDRVHGHVKRNVDHNWLIPLEFQRCLAARHKSIELYRCSTAVLLRGFKHIAGVSGTTSEDVLEYLLRFHLVTVVIPRRSPRYAGRWPD